MSNVTPEQILAIGDALRAEPTTYAAMPTEWQDALTAAMRPHKLHGFDGQQRAWIYSWLLEVTAEQLETLQSLHSNQYTARESTDGKLYLSAALLTDALDGRRLHEAADMLTSLTLVWHEVPTFPVPEEEEEL